MNSALEEYIRIRAREQGYTLAALCKAAGITRQALYETWRPGRLPRMRTLVALATVLEVHPLWLLKLVFSEQSTDEKPLPPESSRDGSAFIADHSFPDGSPVGIGETFHKVWELQNVGQTPWRDRFLDCQDVELLVYTRDGDRLKLAPPLRPAQWRVPVPATEPGETVMVGVDFTAPDAPGTVLSYWKMAFEDGTLCFPESRGVWVKVQVVAALGAAEV